MEKVLYTRTARGGPERLLRLLYLVAAFSMATILSVASYGIYGVYGHHVVKMAEDDAVSISESIVALESHLFLHPDAEGVGQLIVDETEFAELDETLKKVLVPYDIVKIKVFSRDGEIIYSTDHGIIGRVDADNPRLQGALGGAYNSNMQTKDKVSDLVDEKRFDVDVVETYVPIRNDRGDIVGSFEIYQDMTKHRADILTGVGTSVSILAAILGAVFGASYLIIKAGVAELKRTQEKLHRLATTDALTGIFNRGEIMARVEEEFARVKRSQNKRTDNSFSLILADIDRFKNINDKYGHPVGDLILREVAFRISSAVREYDFLGRYGGEEFLILLPGATPHEARTVAERVRQAVRQEAFETSCGELSVCLSLGVSYVQGHEAGYEQALKRADEGLYLAKEGGRDRVSWVQNPVPSGELHA